MWHFRHFRSFQVILLQEKSNNVSLYLIFNDRIYESWTNKVLFQPFLYTFSHIVYIAWGQSNWIYHIYFKFFSIDSSSMYIFKQIANICLKNKKKEISANLGYSKALTGGKYFSLNIEQIFFWIAVCLHFECFESFAYFINKKIVFWIFYWSDVEKTQKFDNTNIYFY